MLTDGSRYGGYSCGLVLVGVGYSCSRSCSNRINREGGKRQSLWIMVTHHSLPALTRQTCVEDVGSECFTLLLILKITFHGLFYVVVAQCSI